jgi:hypothetical protein
MGGIYRLVHTADYEAELRAISAGADVVEQMLDKGAYHTLRNDPLKTRPMSSTGLRVIRQQVIRGVLMVQIYYRVDETNHEVILVSIREIDMTIL